MLQVYTLELRGNLTWKVESGGFLVSNDCTDVTVSVVVTAEISLSPVSTGVFPHCWIDSDNWAYLQEYPLSDMLLPRKYLSMPADEYLRIAQQLFNAPTLFKHIHISHGI